MTQIKQFVFNPFQENTYVLHDGSDECVIIDAGCYTSDEVEQLNNYITAAGLKPKYLVNTHGHVDHVLGNGAMKHKYSIEILGHTGDNMLLLEAKEHGMIFGLRVESPPPIDVKINENDTIKFGQTELLVIHTPGHSPGGICLLCKEGNFIITGDTLFRGSIGRTDLPGGNHSSLIDSISTKLFNLNEKLVVYPGHGPTSTIEWEKANNPFFNSMWR